MGSWFLPSVGCILMTTERTRSQCLCWSRSTSVISPLRTDEPSALNVRGARSRKRFFKARIRPSFRKPLRQLVQFDRVQIRNDPVGHAHFRPMNEMIALPRLAPKITRLAPGIRPNEEIDEMLAAFIDKGCHGPAIEIIQSSADKRKAIFFQIGHRRREIQF